MTFHVFVTSNKCFIREFLELLMARPDSNYAFDFTNCLSCLSYVASYKDTV
jgi:hypothetical protein